MDFCINKYTPLNSSRWDLFTIIVTGQLFHRIQNLRWTSPAIVDSSTGLQTWKPTSWEDALLPQQEPTAIPISWQDGGKTAAESKERSGQRYWVRGFTHLTTDADQKLLWLHYPNSHLWRMLRRTGGEGRGRKEEQHKIKKIIKDRSRGMVVKAGTQLNDVH